MRLLIACHAIFFSVTVWGAEPLPVTVRSVANLVVHLRGETMAEVVAVRDTLLAAEVAGRIRNVLVQVGDQVATGDLLVVQDDRLLKLRVDEAEGGLQELRANRDLAVRQAARAQTLREKGQATDEQLERRETERAVLEAGIRRQEATLAALRLQAEQCRITAPFAGQVVTREAQPGLWAGPGTPLLRLVDTRETRVAAQMAAGQAEQMEKITGWFFVQGGQRIPLIPQVLLRVASSTARTREARFTLTGASPPVGSSGRLVWEDVRPHLPAWLIVRREGKLGVFLVQDGKGVFQVLPEAQEGRPVPLDAGLPIPTTAMLVIKGREALTDGQAVRISKDAAE
ncbi:MAG: efflux RND transporter periplasmic adaptor subunit [Magnetococcales bacterium]|nr:efflux RND transporter periplasmic adaptor subunit [Magnetococcales bacterium]MBF0322395.1 efflux RND transporter periplasmic adaptor subunit [Magnetococcales bacterium]